MGDELMDYQSEYMSKRCTPQQAVQLIRDGDWVDYTQGITFPQLLGRRYWKKIPIAYLLRIIPGIAAR